MPSADPNLPADTDAVCRLSGKFTLRSGQIPFEYFEKYLLESHPALLARVWSRCCGSCPGDTEIRGGLGIGVVLAIT